MGIHFGTSPDVRSPAEHRLTHHFESFRSHEQRGTNIMTTAASTATAYAKATLLAASVASSTSRIQGRGTSELKVSWALQMATSCAQAYVTGKTSASRPADSCTHSADVRPAAAVKAADSTGGPTCRISFGPDGSPSVSMSLGGVSCSSPSFWCMHPECIFSCMHWTSEKGLHEHTASA